MLRWSVRDIGTPALKMGNDIAPYKKSVQPTAATRMLRPQRCGHSTRGILIVALDVASHRPRLSPQRELLLPNRKIIFNQQVLTSRLLQRFIPRMTLGMTACPDEPILESRRIAVPVFLQEAYAMQTCPQRGRVAC